MVFRGYLQRQLHAFTGSHFTAVIAQGIIFGLFHAYQGWKSVIVITCSACSTALLLPGAEIFASTSSPTPGPISGKAGSSSLSGAKFNLTPAPIPSLTPNPVPGSIYNRPMSFLGDPRRRSMILLAGGVVLFFALLGALQAFKLSEVRFLNPETSGETLAFVRPHGTGFSAAAVAADAALPQHSQALRGSGRQRPGCAPAHAPGRGRGTHRSHSRGLHVPLQLSAHEPLHRSLVFAAHCANCARTRTASCSNWRSTPPAMRTSKRNRLRRLARWTTSPQHFSRSLTSHRITLEGGFAVVYDKDRHVLASFQAPPQSSPASLIAWLDEAGPQWSVLLQGSLSTQILLPAAQRSDETVLRWRASEYALGSRPPSREDRGRCAARAPGPQPDHCANPRRRCEYCQLFRSRRSIRTTFSLMLLLITVFVFFSSVWVAYFFPSRSRARLRRWPLQWTRSRQASTSIACPHCRHRRNG